MSTHRRVAARHLWTPTGLTGAAAVVLDAGHTIVDIAEVRAHETVLDGILMPGWVNAHTHLELSHHTTPAGARGLGSPGWVAAMLAAQIDRPPDSAQLAARRARSFGTAFLIDVSNGGDTASIMTAARLRGTVQHELIGLTESRWAAALSQTPTGTTAVTVRPTAHALISCSPDLLRAALSQPGPPATILCDEDHSDASLLAHRNGPWVGFHEAIAARAHHPWRDALGRAASGVELLEQLGLLSDLGLVHLTAARDEDLDRVARAGATAVLCPRSNQHITDRLPDLPGMVSRGIPVALGTDSKASSPDLDLLAEAAVLHKAFPEVDPAVLVGALVCNTLLPHHPSAGRLTIGQRPDVLLVEVPDGPNLLHRLLDGTRWPRRWLT